MLFIIPIESVPWKRTGGSGRRRFTDPRYGAFKNNLAMRVRAHKECPKRPLQGPVVVEIRIHVPMPVSWSKKKREAMFGNPCTSHQKGDWDNLGKAVSDSLNGIVWQDDIQIWDGRTVKVWSREAKIFINVNETK